MHRKHWTSIAAISLLATPQLALAQAADLVIHNADIRTMDDANPEAEAVAITGDTITYVGNDAGVKAYIDDDTRVIDAEDHLLIPGFQETHLHLLVAAATISGLVLQQTDSPEDVARKLGEFAKAHPDRKAIFGSGLNSALIVSGELNRAILDAVVSDRPVVILGETNHNAWVNSKALEVAKITRETKDPDNGTYVRDANGESTGVIQGSPAHLPVIVATNAISSEAIAGAMPEMLNILSSFGFTGAIDMGFPLATEEGYQSLVDLDNEGKLPLRVSLAYFVNSVAAGDKVLATIDDFSKRFKSDHVWLDTVKIVGDGVVENRKAAFLEPYLDTGESGALTLPVDYMNNLVLKSARKGYNVVAHVVGDKGNRAILDAYEAARKAGHKDVNLSTTHSWWVKPEDVPRWQKNNVFVQTTGIWAFTRPSYLEALGKERFETEQFPYRSWEDSGAVVALGADYPATDGGINGLNPFNNIYSLLTRKLAPPLIGNVAGTEEQLPPYDQIMTIAEAVEGYTANGARMMGKFDEFGSITVGKKADMIVLSQNLFNIDVSDVPKTMVLMTMMDGKVRYLEPELAAGPLADLDIGHDWQED
ncbi:amidohydrolase [Altererythrobacter sp.]|uniref:amidohydrolase n=1 Tax=Altererythrobacter sp. TaxID=1872480 RepID=UPI003CFDFE89